MGYFVCWNLLRTLKLMFMLYAYNMWHLGFLFNSNKISCYWCVVCFENIFHDSWSVFYRGLNWTLMFTTSSMLTIVVNNGFIVFSSMETTCKSTSQAFINPTFSHPFTIMNFLSFILNQAWCNHSQIWGFKLLIFKSIFISIPYQHAP